jgi:hypothetical protein
LQAFAVHIEQPAVECAAQAAVLQTPIGQVSATMRARAADQAVAPLVVFENHEIFAEKLNGLDRPVPSEFIDQRGRLPVAAQ